MSNKIKIGDLKKECFLGDLGEYFCDYDSGHICDIISEIADNHTPIYYSDIWEQAKENSDYVEEALLEFGTPTNNKGVPDIIKILQQGIYFKNEQDLYENLEESLKNFAYNYIEYELKIKEITEEENNELLEWDFTDNNETLENLIEHINNIFIKEEI